MKRLDVYLVENNIIKSRAKAQELIKNNCVKVNGNIVDKCSYLVEDKDNIEIVNDICPYVSRAGLKLEGACKEFKISMQDKVVLDIGSSTGGFTDYCLKNGAKKVYCIDVGTNQLHNLIKSNKNVVVYENTDIRSLDINLVKDVNFIVCDVSFISLTKISTKIAQVLKNGAMGIVLIKPQFECGKTIAKKHKGIIKDKNIHKIVIDNITKDFLSKNIKILNIKESCITGTDGNVEYVVLIKS